MASCGPAGRLSGGGPSAALLEVCVHTSANDVPPEFTLLKIARPDVEVLVIKPEDLPPELEDASRSDSLPGDGMGPEQGGRPI